MLIGFHVYTLETVLYISFRPAFEYRLKSCLVYRFSSLRPSSMRREDVYIVMLESGRLIHGIRLFAHTGHPPINQFLILPL